MRPDHPREGRAQSGSVGFICLGAARERCAALDTLAQATEHVSDLALGMKDDAARVCQVCPGPVQAVEVRESRYRDAEIRGRLITPLLAQVGAAAPDYLHRREKAVGVKAGREHDHVDFVTASGYVDHRVLVDR